MNSETIQNLRNKEYEKNLFLVTNDFSQIRPSTSSSNLKGFSQYSSIMSKKSDSQMKQDTFARKKLNAVLLAQQLNDKLIEQGVLKNNYGQFDTSKGQTVDTKSQESSLNRVNYNYDSNSGNDKKNGYYFSKLSDNINEERQYKINMNQSSNK